MKKLVRTNLTNTPSRRGTENLNIQFYSHDRNNAGFEFVVKNETDLSQYTAKVLFKFRDSNSTWLANGTIEGNIVKVSFNTDLIARCEEVLGFLFLDSDSDSLDVFKFKFNVVLSEIDKGEVANRQIKHVNNIGELELVTRSQLTEELSKLQINGVDLTNYLTTTVAEETYVKKSDLPTPYNDSALVERVTNLENRTDRDTVYNDTEVKQRLTALENKPSVNPQDYDDRNLSNRVSNLEKGVMVNDAEVKHRLTTLEGKTDNFISGVSVNKEGSNVTLTYTYVDGQTKNVSFTDSDTVNLAYDDSGLKARLTNLENRPQVDVSNYALKSELYNDTALSDRVTALETKVDKDTVYDDSYIKARVETLERRPTLDTTKFITEETLTAKKIVTRDELNTLKPNQTLTLNNNTLSITGGNSVELPVNRYEIHGTGMPNGVVEAPIGTTYVDKNKTNGALKWIKTTNGGNTGWKVFTGDTGWYTLPLRNKRGNARLQIRRINDEIIVKFDGLSWGWFGVDDISNQAGNIVDKTIAGKKYTWIKLNIGQGDKVLPEGFRSASSLLSGLCGDLGDLLGSVYVGGTADSNAIQLRYAMGRNEITSNILSQIRISPITFVTDDEWPVQLP